MANRNVVLLDQTTLGTSESATSNTFVNKTNKGGKFVLDVTTLDAGILTFRIQAKDPASGDFYNTSANTINAVGKDIVDVYPGVSGAPGDVDTSSSTILSRAYRVIIDADGSVGTAVFTVGAALVG